MSDFLPPMRLVGATVLRDGQLQDRSVALADGRITRGPLPEVDLTGYYILPGIIDLHGDGFERHIAPRPSAPFPVQTGLAGYDREAAANGVTTAFLAQGWSWEGGPRSPDAAEVFFAELDTYRPRALTDLRIQVRAETHLTDDGARLIAAVRRHRIGFVVFNDHLAEAIDTRRNAPADFTAWARKIGRDPDALWASVEAAASRASLVPRHLCTLAEAFDAMGVEYGSHDDPDGDTRERFRMIGARIAEFPTSYQAAAAAKAMGSPVLMGAPNIVRGRSQAGNIAAAELVAAGACDALVSDYHLPALALAAWRMVDTGMADLARAWGMISTAPADVLHLADRGRIAPGLRADLVVVDKATRAIEATIAGGRLAYLSGRAAGRFLAGFSALRMAAE
jgi:alpha-D-ribose 1-methylphosphonate 5-triphosphate diphosphatase